MDGAPFGTKFTNKTPTYPNLHNFTKTNAALSAHKPKRSWTETSFLSIAFFKSMTTSIKWRHCNQIHQLSTKQSPKPTNYTPRCRSPHTNARLTWHLDQNNLRLLSWTLATSIGSESRNALNQRLETPRITHHITTLRECRDETAQEHIYLRFLLQTLANTRIGTATFQPNSQKSQKTNPNRAPEITKPSVILHAHTSANDATTMFLSLKLTCSETQCECEWESSRASGDVGKTDARDIHSHGHGHVAYGLAMARI